MYAVGYRIGSSPLSPAVRRTQVAVFSVLCVPGLSFILYYLHLTREPAWYIEFRSFPYVEMSSAFWGLLFGCLEIRRPLIGKWRYVAGNRMMLRLSMLLIFAPFAKPVLLPLAASQIKDEWREDVCIQSTAATCGPCSLATVYRSLGLQAKERDIARGAFSGKTGTENWYLIRYARRHGLNARFGYKTGLSEVTPPSIIGVKLDGGAGHFITYLGDAGKRKVIGDPLSGKLLLTDANFHALYRFTGTAIEFTPRSQVR
ncbi:MAG: peptidase C39 [Elusimicrobia bacterium]|nr:peptidase C39 [Elusimicrobiota bacterium]